MLKGKELGDAITKAIELKIAKGSAASKKEITDYYEIKPPSIHDWIKKGSISKDKLPKLWDYFSDVVGPEHWGLNVQSFIFENKELSVEKNSDEGWLRNLNMNQYSLVKKFALKVAEMGDAGIKATDKIVDGTVDAINAGGKTKRNKRKKGDSD